MKSLIIVALCFLAVASAWPNLKYQSANPCVDKLSGLRIRSWVFTGSSGWSGTATDVKKRPQNIRFNISSNPGQGFITAASAVTKTSIGLWGSIIRQYKMYDVKSGFAIQTANSITTLGRQFTTTNTIENQRKKFYSCARYVEGTYGTINFKHQHYACTDFEITQDLNEDNWGANMTLTYAGLGTTMLYWQYRHTQSDCIPLYVKSVQVNKIRAFSAPNSVASWDSANVVGIASLGWMATDLAGISTAWSTGFFIGNSQVGSVQSLSRTQRLSIMFSQYHQFCTTPGPTGGCSTAYKWQTYVNQEFRNLEFYCGRTVQAYEGAVEVEFAVTCTFGAMMKFSAAILMAVAGFFALV